jgi:hypothetical protein
MLRSLRSLSLALAVAGLLAPAAANAAPVVVKAGTAKSKKASSKKTSSKKSKKKSSKKKSSKKKSSKKKSSKKKSSKKKSHKVTYPTVSRVRPMAAGIGDKLVLKGKGYKSGKAKNYVVFKRDKGRALFVKADKATSTQITVTIPAKLLGFLTQKAGVPVATRFHLRVMATRLAKSYTKTGLSPLISAKSGSGAGLTDDCDSDGIPNAKDADDDNDLLPDTEEARIKTDPCKPDSDGDGMSDGWEQQSAVDRNGGSVLPSPKTKPYPNALDKDDSNIDSDGDGLTNLEEYTAWATFGGHKIPLSYSGGNPTSAGRGAPSPVDARYADRDRNGYLSDLERDADGDGIPNMDEMRTGIDAARITKSQSSDDDNFYDYGIFTTSYIKLAEEATKSEQCVSPGLNQVPFYCVDQLKPDAIKSSTVDTLDWLSTDTDGDGLDDGNDDVDHDDFSNVSEFHNFIDGGFKHRKYEPLNACVPNADSRFCLLGGVDIDKDGLPNAVDTDDDGDGLSDTDELTQEIDTNPLLSDTDGDGVGDGFEYFSAKDLNINNRPYPYARPYPNPLDGRDGDSDFDQDSLTQKEEFQAWWYTYCGAEKHSCRPTLPLTYSDGTQFTGGKTLASGALAKYDTDQDGFISDDEKDVDHDYLTNYEEAHGPLSGPDWWDTWMNDATYRCSPQYVESTYPGPAYEGLSFINPDTDGDRVLDGQDDIDHDGYSNWFEAWRPWMTGLRGGLMQDLHGVFAGPWCMSYTSTKHPVATGAPTYTTPDTNDLARVQPFNPCKPTYSEYCHRHLPPGIYEPAEDWESPVHGTLPIPPGVEPWT